MVEESEGGKNADDEILNILTLRRVDKRENITQILSHKGKAVLFLYLYTYRRETGGVKITEIDSYFAPMHRQTLERWINELSVCRSFHINRTHPRDYRIFFDEPFSQKLINIAKKTASDVGDEKHG